MNLQLDNAISDAAGQTGMRILRAIIAGERDPFKPARLRHQGIRASEEKIVKPLQGSWREEHLFTLKQAVELHDAYGHALEDCNRRLGGVLDRPASGAVESAGKRTNARYDLKGTLIRICGVDLTRIDGIDTGTALKFISEAGPDLSRFTGARRFASWLGLRPGTKISGGKVLSGASKRTANRFAQALRMAAMALRRSQSALGAYYRRLCGRLDKAKEITATARKPARLIDTMVTKESEYLDQGQAYCEERYRQRVLRHLNRKAAAMGFRLTPAGPEVVEGHPYSQMLGSCFARGRCLRQIPPIPTEVGPGKLAVVASCMPGCQCWAISCHAAQRL